MQLKSVAINKLTNFFFLSFFVTLFHTVLFRSHYVQVTLKKYKVTFSFLFKKINFLIGGKFLCKVLVAAVQ